MDFAQGLRTGDTVYGGVGRGGGGVQEKNLIHPNVELCSHV